MNNEHTVEVDEGAAEDVFNQYAEAEGEYIPAGRQLPPPEGGQDPEQEAGESWSTAANFIAGFLNAKICPNWEVDEATQQKWADALAVCLEDLFPGGLGGMDNWGPWPKLAFATGTWVMCGIDFQTMKFKPLHPPKDDDEAGETVIEEGEERQPQPQRPRTSGSFTIG